MPKRLIICCDGTWNKFDEQTPSNLRRLTQLIKPSASDGTVQSIRYQEGIGTRWYDKLPGGAFGAGIDQKIQDVYQFLCLNYEPGDEIYLFGYSRGAYTVRSLGGLIDCIGLLTPNNTGKIAAAYKIYRIPQADQRQAAAADFQATHQTHARVPIALLGCWDTVGALGIPDLIPNLPIDYWVNKPYRFHDTNLSPLIQHALHATALDEQHKVFALTPMQVPAGSPTQLRQMWFPGDHARVGLSFSRGLADLTLDWLIRSIDDFDLGLEFDRSKVNALRPNALDATIPDLYAQRKRLSISFLTLPGLQVREIAAAPNPANRLQAFHPGVTERWCQDPNYRPKSLLDQGWRSMFNDAC
ncbi:DUF2235 domain-containing protein [filamentous cyanobacterium LEGE 11480]|uniref:DUF2235 domain-containing protein n=1 Tax=Romeriopsis navalis LEGE 11480 TaxID=2777977 RepID=A0A928VRA9_9CYAN|nr:DUF2235 domain-containing protein [Romeriopsis navalis]MBE9033075.1 DUF2235 domain-containing protein [Romeriopsis navalis LEGE 11480]